MKSLLTKARQYIEQAHNPIIFFDDDADGLCSALLLHRTFDKGHCIVLGGAQEQLAMTVARKIEEYTPDLVIFADKAVIPLDILESLPQTIWIDHHEPQEVSNNVLYVNPQLFDSNDNRPTTYWVYELCGRPPKDLWMAALGIIADWQLTDVFDTFSKDYKHLIDDAKTAPEVMFTTPFGLLIRLFSFNLHGKSTDRRKAINILSRVTSPEEILEQRTDQTKLLYKRYLFFQKQYEALHKDIVANAKVNDKHVIFTYGDTRTSFTSYVSNQLLFEHPGKLIVIARLRNNTYRCSFRITPPYDLSGALAKVFTRFPGEGGGHMQACGARIPEAVFADVIAALEEELFQ